MSDITLAFASETEAYTVDAPVEVAVTTVSATASHNGATVEITPVDDDGDAGNGHQVKLAVGENTIEVLVTAQDATTEKTYTVTVNRAQRWSAARAREWGEEHGWLVGANYIPRYAINQLEHWQADTFDIDTIDEELGWAADLGMNVMRVYLHDLPYREDSAGLLDRVDQYLTVADGHGIATILVLLDDAWDPDPQSGTQPAPTPGVHNSGWVQSPGRAILGNLEAHDSLKPYVEGVLAHFDGDERVIAFDVYNEPGNPNTNSYGTGGKNTELPNKSDFSLALLQKAFQWARAANPAQPVLVSGWTTSRWLNRYKFVGWDNLDEITRFSFEHSDIIGFHNYSPVRTFRIVMEVLSERFDRPIIATEYMARPEPQYRAWFGHTFREILPLLKEHGFGAINWGLVSGKSQTIYSHGTLRKPNLGEPDPWFHDVLKPNCAPYDPYEAALIRRLTGTTSGNRLPAFDDGTSASRSLAENTSGGENVGAAVSAQDGDGGTLVYMLEGADADSFGVVGTSGQLTTKAGVAYDYEVKSSYSVRLRVEDGQCGAATIDVAVNLTDVGESPAPPRVVAASSTRLAVTWTEPTSTSSDIDDYDVQYREGGSGGFTSWPHNSASRAATIANLTPAKAYQVRVRAHNAEGRSEWSGAGAGSTAANELPVFADGSSATRSLAENTTGVQGIGDAVSATDPEGTDLTYGLEGQDAGAFTIDEGSGLLRTIEGTAYDYETKPQYSVTVRATDEHGGHRAIPVVVDLTDRDEIPAPPRVVAASSTRLAVTWTEPTSTSSDIDDYDVQYREGGSGGFTSWPHNSASRAATIANLTPAKAYQVRVRAHNAEGRSEWSGAGAGSTAANELPVFADGSSATRSLAENTTGVQGIGDAVSATDPEGTDLTYGLEGQDAAAFTIDEGSGLLRTIEGTAYDYETKPQYSVTVRATDEHGGHRAIPVVVDLTDRDEPPTQASNFPDPTNTTTTDPNAENPPAGSDASTDPDGPTTTDSNAENPPAGSDASTDPDGPRACASEGASHPFTDVLRSSFAHDAVACIYGLGITVGTTATTYGPAANVTRAQMAVFLSRLHTAVTGTSAPVVDPLPFTDTADSFARNHIARIYGLGITAGTTATTYGPAANVTRAQMAVFLSRLHTAVTGTSAPVVDPLPFTDTADSFARNHIARIYGLGITAGTTATTYGPAANVTRAQMAVFLSRLHTAVTADTAN